jgi:hypothetical protein
MILAGWGGPATGLASKSAGLSSSVPFTDVALVVFGLAGRLA